MSILSALALAQTVSAAPPNPSGMLRGWPPPPAAPAFEAMSLDEVTELLRRTCWSAAADYTALDKAAKQAGAPMKIVKRPIGVSEWRSSRARLAGYFGGTSRQTELRCFLFTTVADSPSRDALASSAGLALGLVSKPLAYANRLEWSFEKDTSRGRLELAWVPATAGTNLNFRYTYRVPMKEH